MTEEEAIARIEKIYDEAFIKLRAIKDDQDLIIKKFQDKLNAEKIKNEQNKIHKIREELLKKEDY